MGMSASQARFLELTKRKSDVEYQAQRINFERLQLAKSSAEASEKYNNALGNQKLTYTFNTGSERLSVDLTYRNYKTYMNQQGANTAGQKMYLVSSSGNKIVVSNRQEMLDIINANTNEIPISDILAAKDAVNAAQNADPNEATKEVTSYQKYLAKLDIETQYTSRTDEKGIEYYVESKFSESDFMIVEDLDDTDSFQQNIKDGVYYFATYGVHAGEDRERFRTLEWETLEAGAINEVYDKSDDALAQAEYDRVMNQIQAQDKKLELQLDECNTERDAIQTEMEAVKKVIDENVESTFKAFS